MSHIAPRLLRPIKDWDDVADWLAESIEALDRFDVFDVGPRHGRVDNPDIETPCAQATALDGGVLLRLSTRYMSIPALSDHSVENVPLDVWHRGETFEDCTFGFIVSDNTQSLALACVNWFRDKHRLHFTDLGCELRPAVSLQGLSSGGEDDGRW